MLHLTSLDPSPSEWPSNVATLPKINSQCHNDHLDTKNARNEDEPVLKPKTRNMGAASKTFALTPKMSLK